MRRVAVRGLEADVHLFGVPSSLRWAIALTLPEAGMARSTGPITAVPLSSGAAAAETATE
ncbi:hypothetical protein BH24ACT10_BH24ACT10_17580 [soil metagenome]